MDNNTKIAIIGLGYVGLPLAVSFGRQYKTIGLDINQSRVDELKAGEDCTLEVSKKELANAKKLIFTSDVQDVKSCDFVIVTVPTPIDKNKQPDMTPLQKASQMIGSVLRRNMIVIYESTVYPGATEEVCIPILEKVSGLTFNKDF